MPQPPPQIPLQWRGDTRFLNPNPNTDPNPNTNRYFKPNTNSNPSPNNSLTPEDKQYKYYVKT